MTTEMLHSEAPWAIARTLTPEEPSALNSLAAMPGVPAMPSPTTARMLQSRVTSTRRICPRAPRQPAAAPRQDAAVARDVPPLDLSLPQLALEGVAHDQRGAVRLLLI